MIEFKGIEFPPDFEGNVQKAFATRQNALDAKAIALMEDYVPIAQPRFANRGKMSKSHKQQKPGVIINTEPRARREYYINKGHSGPMRGKRWLDRMKADHMSELMRTAKEGK